MVQNLATKAYALRDTDLLTASVEEKPYVLRVRDLPSEERPREKLLLVGAHELTITELIAVLWGVGTRKEEVLSMARRTVKEYGEKTIGHEQDPQKLSDAAAIPLSKACQVVAGIELGRRFYAQQAGRPVQVRSARQAYRYVKDIGFSRKEQLRGLYLNSRYQVIHDEVISIGSLTASIVHPREVFQPAIEHGAIAILLAHNHPSGRLEPTQADIAVTSQLIEAGRVLGIDVLDHLIITTKTFSSIKECLDE